VQALDAFGDCPGVPRFVLADLGYEGEGHRLLCRFKVTKTTVPDGRRRSGKKNITVPLSDGK